MILSKIESEMHPNVLKGWETDVKIKSICYVAGAVSRLERNIKSKLFQTGKSRGSIEAS